MKINEIAGGKVWVLGTEEDYEATYVHGIYTSKAAATKAIKQLDEADLEFRRPKIFEVNLNEFSDGDLLQ